MDGSLLMQINKWIYSSSCSWWSCGLVHFTKNQILLLTKPDTLQR